MNVLLNPGNTPITAGLLRGVVAGVIIGCMAGLAAYAQGMTTNMAVSAGFAAALPVWLGLTGYGVADQVRANQGISAPADVPSQVVAEDKKITPVAAAEALSK